MAQGRWNGMGRSIRNTLGLSRSTHGARLERWLGAEKVEALSRAMRGWYGPPIALHGVPGNVWATGDGDFIGPIAAGFEMSALDRFADRFRQIRRGLQRALREHVWCGAGFSSLSDLISEATTGGKRREFMFNKSGPTGVVNVTSSLWKSGPQPAAAGNAANAPGGTVFDDSSTGAFLFTNPSGSDTQHIVSAFVNSSVAGDTLLLYDRLFGVNKTMASTSTEAVTGVPSRYQSTTGTNLDYIGGNFLTVEVGGTALAATAHNWTSVLYNDQADASSTLPSLTGNSGAIAHQLDHPAGQWFAPLETGDVGVKKLTQMQCSASVATGEINFVLGHPIAWMPCLVASINCIFDYINTAFNLARIFDDAALAFYEVVKPSTTAATYTGTFTTVAG